MGIEVALVFFYFDLVYPWISVFGFEYHGRLIDMRFGRFARKGARGLFAKKTTTKTLVPVCMAAHVNLTDSLHLLTLLRVNMWSRSKPSSRKYAMHYLAILAFLLR